MNFIMSTKTRATTKKRGPKYKKSWRAFTLEVSLLDVAHYIKTLLIYDRFLHWHLMPERFLITCSLAANYLVWSYRHYQHFFS